MDADNSGSITVDELKAGMKKAGSPVALAELQALLSHIDVDANGELAPPPPKIAHTHMSLCEPTQPSCMVSTLHVFDARGRLQHYLARSMPQWACLCIDNIAHALHCCP